MTKERIFLFEDKDRKALGFDTGLDARSFARGRLARLITGTGVIVRLGDQICAEPWKASGVIEISGEGRPTMVIWGPPFGGERLDFILDGSRDRALAAVAGWIQAILIHGKKLIAGIPFWPCAALIDDDGGNRAPEAVFFAPFDLAKYCLITGEAAFSGGEWYVHCDLDGMDAAAFTAAAMLYRIFAGTPPFSSADEITLHRDMREGNFLPVRLAAPGLDEKLAALIQRSLTKTAGDQGTGLLEDMLSVLCPAGKAVAAASLIRPLDDAAGLALEKEKDRFLKTKNRTVKARLFFRRNTAVIAGCIAFIFVTAFIGYTAAKTSAFMPGTNPEDVIGSYYNAFGELDHQLMEACVTGRAGKDDINMVTQLFVIGKVRQAYETNAPLSGHVLGVTDLQITMSSEQGAEIGGQLSYCVEYTFWLPVQTDDNADEVPVAGVQEVFPAVNPPLSFQRRDFITLVRKKGNWRISEIRREEK